MFAILLAATIILASFAVLVCANKRDAALPPGPWNLPLIGCLHKLDPERAYVNLTKLAQKYGPIYSIRLGKVSTVVISDHKLLKKVLMKDEALGRPSLYFFDYICRGKGITYSHINVWKDQRKFISDFLRSVGGAKVSAKKEALENEIRRSVEEFVYVSLKLNRSYENKHKIKIGEHPMRMFQLVKSYEGSGILLAEAVTSYVGTVTSTLFLGKSCPHEIYNLEELRYLILDMFGASTETTVTSILWTVLYLAKYEDVQEKVRQELLSVLNGKTPQMGDLENLPYTEATLAEVARIRTTVAMGVPHLALEDIYVENFKIQKNTMIMPLLWAIHMNPNVWNEPEEFRPSRFLNDERKFVQPEELLPFSVGKRMCVGEHLAKMLIFLFMATILQTFKIESCEPEIDLSAVCGITLLPKPQKVVFKNIDK
ncbi:cytochrome P450 2J6-like [Zophobas morio]|uniref:cytochrome P450 2J6-like n=1 Tax=Zophobas morio TaxID=2755281 RepID=UPI003083C96E